METKTELDPDVETNVSAQQSLLPLLGKIGLMSKRKQNRKKTSQGLQKNNTEAKRKKGGSRVVLGKVKSEHSGPNKCRCLPKSILVLLSAAKKKVLWPVMDALMPSV